jgi:hypothetical protein
MIVFGAGASTCAAACEQRAASRLTEVAITTVPAGTSTSAAERAGRISSAQAAVASAASLRSDGVARRTHWGSQRQR